MKFSIQPIIIGLASIGTIGVFATSTYQLGNVVSSPVVSDPVVSEPIVVDRIVTDDNPYVDGEKITVNCTQNLLLEDGEWTSRDDYPGFEKLFDIGLREVCNK